MDKRFWLLVCLAFSSCPPVADYEPKTSSSISYCSGGQLWYPGHSAPSGPCPDPAVVTAPLGDLA